MVITIFGGVELVVGSGQSGLVQERMKGQFFRVL